MANYYFDGSDASATDPNNVWTNETNIFDGDITTTATCGTTGDTTTNYTLAEGTNAPDYSTSTIYNVMTRVYANQGSDASIVFAAIYTNALAELLGTAQSAAPTGLRYGLDVVLATPAGGWTWAKVAALEVKVYISDQGINPTVGQVEITVDSGAPTHFYLRQGFQ